MTRGLVPMIGDQLPAQHTTTIVAHSHAHQTSGGAVRRALDDEASGIIMIYRSGKVELTSRRAKRGRGCSTIALIAVGEGVCVGTAVGLAIIIGVAVGTAVLLAVGAVVAVAVGMGALVAADSGLTTTSCQIVTCPWPLTWMNHCPGKGFSMTQISSRVPLSPPARRTCISSAASV